jgi:hypothetical protein
MATETLCAYYSRECDSRALFESLKIGRDSSFEKHLNKYNVIFFGHANVSQPNAWSSPACGKGGKGCRRRLEKVPRSFSNILVTVAT